MFFLLTRHVKDKDEMLTKRADNTSIIAILPEPSSSIIRTPNCAIFIPTKAIDSIAAKWSSTCSVNQVIKASW
jgi:hypothetical protein